MRTTILAVHEGLRESPRLRWATSRTGAISAAELLVLVTMGVCATALSAYLKLGLGIPGHNIVRVVFPMAMGLALVPRKGAASVMGGSALASAFAVSTLGAARLGVGAMTSLILTGFFIDAALVGARSGRSVYLRLILAGIAANLVAMLMKGTAEPHLGFAAWLSKAAITYPLCGAIAGVLSAAAWFRFSKRA
jgi:uncharacterized membrane protein YczE